jgi:hypothetical protein
VQVDVVDDSRTRDPPEVPADVEALRLHGRGERGQSGGREPVNFEGFVVPEVAELSFVAVRSHEQMT